MTLMMFTKVNQNEILNASSFFFTIFYMVNFASRTGRFFQSNNFVPFFFKSIKQLCYLWLPLKIEKAPQNLVQRKKINL